jgi:hypothetical protein
VSVTFDLGGAPEEFVRALLEYRNELGMENSKAVNRAGSNVAFRAIENTLKADRSKIKSELVRLDSITFVGKGLKRRRLLKANRRIENYKGTAAGYASFFAKLKKGKLYYKGFPSVPINPPNKKGTGLEYLQIADNYLKKRVNSAGLFAAGWLWPARKLREAYDAAGGKAFGKTGLRKGMAGRKRGGVGEGIPASPGLHATATIINRSVNPRDPTSVTAAQRIIPPALLLAFQDVARDMQEYITSRLNAKGRDWRAKMSSTRRF